MKKQAITKSILFTILFIFLVALDQLTKYLATVNLKDKDPFVIIKGVFEFNYLDGGNTGAAWGIFSGNIVFLVLAPILVCIILILLVFRVQRFIKNTHENNPDKYRSVYLRYTIIQVVVVAILSGAVGNLIDRIANHYVVDFLYFKLIDFPIFNVADCYVTVSMFCIILIFVFWTTDEEFSEIISIKSPVKKTVTIEKIEHEQIDDAENQKSQ